MAPQDNRFEQLSDKTGVKVEWIRSMTVKVWLRAWEGRVAGGPLIPAFGMSGSASSSTDPWSHTFETRECVGHPAR